MKSQEAKIILGELSVSVIDSIKNVIARESGKDYGSVDFDENQNTFFIEYDKYEGSTISHKLSGALIIGAQNTELNELEDYQELDVIELDVDVLIDILQLIE
jgi:hypothetical protein